MDFSDFNSHLEAALLRRKPLISRLEEEQTDAFRLFHGVVDGATGLTIDRYGDLILIQTFRDPLSPEALKQIESSLRERLRFRFDLAYNHRGKKPVEDFNLWHRPDSAALQERRCHEFGVQFLIKARHQGIDPWLFLDLRAARRYLRNAVREKCVLNLFSYTCSVGISAANAGAREVVNVDFASSSLDVGRRNAKLNGIAESQFTTIQEDCLPVMRQFAGLPVGLRPSQKRKYFHVTKREFDFVILDPPAWSKGPFGAVDVAGDYPSLFKPAVLSTKPGGQIIATNHVADVDLDSWIDVLNRCALKAGRAIRSIQMIMPDEDFPSFDGKPPLKVVVAEV